MNKCSMNEWDTFKNIFASINHKKTPKNEQFQTFFSHKKTLNFTAHAHFPSEHHFRAAIVNVTCRFHVLDTTSFLKVLLSIVRGRGSHEGPIQPTDYRLYIMQYCALLFPKPRQNIWTIIHHQEYVSLLLIVQ